MFNRFFVFIILLGLGSISAQTFSPKISHSTFTNGNHLVEIKDVNILAVMVDFQPDDFELTYGDGTFGSIYSQEYGNDIIDPLPHNKSYFEDHLQFAKNYFSKVSNNNVNVDFTVLPNIVTVSMPMREYSPVGDESFKRLANFSEEVWKLVDQQNPNFDYSSFNTFVIFHAGTGKDISTSDLFGEARDLPSIYLGLSTLRNYYTTTFNGFQQSDGTFIDNTIILPETESREEEGFGGVTLIELSINGLIVSSIASHMGLPDLFDAETGKSAIGRFGLMDGQSLFAFGGLFPPEPSAWEKIFLGWEEPQVINSNTTNIFVTASKIAAESDSKIIKVPINSTEYYLIENRARDANNDGVTLTYKVGGETRTINFQEDLNNFNNAIIDTLKGVVLDVDEYDWALPGNGILIWHIDEKIINSKLSINRVNVGKDRGVDLEEADGIQDIGEEFQTIFGDIVIAEGEEFDFWYSSNTSELYKNKFGIDTKPSTKTNSGANSLITFSNFSEINNQMSFDVKFGSDKITQLPQYKLNSNLVLRNYKSSSTGELGDAYFLSGNDLLSIGNKFLPLEQISNDNYGLVENELEKVIVSADVLEIYISTFSDSLLSNIKVETPSEVTSKILLKKNSSTTLDIYAGLGDGSLIKYNYNLVTKEVPTIESNSQFLDSSIEHIAVLESEVLVASQNSLSFLNSSSVSIPSVIKQIILTKNRTGNFVAVISTENNSIYKFVKGQIDAEIIYNDDFRDIENISFGDIKNDGENYIILNSGNNIVAINLVGSHAEKFPFKTQSENFVGTPLIADIDSDGKSDIISSTDQGEIFAISGSDGKVVDGFPLSIGGMFSGKHTIIKRENDLLMSAATDSNEIYFWSISSNGNVDWGSEFGNNSNSSSLGLAKSDNYISTYFPKNKTYNWPNPVYDNETFIRTYVSEDSQVEVKVFDLSGDLVDEFEFRATGGIDTEYAWNVSEIQSGAYFAHLEVKSNSGKSENKIIKIAVVK